MKGDRPLNEVVRRIDESNRKFKEKVASLPAEKRQAIEQEMAVAGVDLRLDKADNVMSARICIDAKEAARLAKERENEKTNCKREVILLANDVEVVQLECLEKYSKQTTTATIVYYADKAQTVYSSMGTFSMRWLSDACPKRNN